jgi:hypothetical protein
MTDYRAMPIEDRLARHVRESILVHCIRLFMA